MPPTDIVSPAAVLEGLSLSDRAYYAVRERILRGQIRLGVPLSSRRLGEELGMSHLPVSQALRRLESEGLLESRPRAGTRVRVPTEKDVRDRCEVREALESQSARLFAARATPAERQELQHMAEHLDGLFNRSAAGDSEAEFLYGLHSYHFQVHMRIAECAGCEALRDLIEKNQVLIMNWLYDVAANRRALPPRFHRDLAAALVTGDPEVADAAMRHHVRYGVEETVRNLKLGVAVEWRARRGPQAGALQRPGSGV